MVIKVADFGLTKSVYEKCYFRQDKSASVKLPIKWMAIESIDDAIFTEKTDVVSWLLYSGLKWFALKCSIFTRYHVI